MTLPRLVFEDVLDVGELEQLGLEQLPYVLQLGLWHGDGRHGQARVEPADAGVRVGGRVCKWSSYLEGSQTVMPLACLARAAIMAGRVVAADGERMLQCFRQ